MYLSAKQMNLLARIMQTLAEPHEEREIRDLMGDLVMQLLQAQYYASFVWRPGEGVFDSCVQINMDPANIRRYEEHYQYHDPITPLMQRYHVAVRATDVMAHQALSKTEFFNDFLHRDGLYWGVNLYAWHRGENLGDMRIWRDRRRENFTHDDLRILDMIQPAFVSALAQARQRKGKGTAGALLSGVSLSPRELETASLVAQGLSDKEVARRLNISAATVRTHLEHCFRKLGVNNRVAMVQKIRV